MPVATIKEAIEDLKQGKMIILVDDEDIELNRGYGAVVRSVWTAPVCLWRR